MEKNIFSYKCSVGKSVSSSLILLFLLFYFLILTVQAMQLMDQVNFTLLQEFFPQ